MSTSSSKRKPTTKLNIFKRILSTVMDDAREMGNPPSTADHLIKGMDAIRDIFDLYAHKPRTSGEEKMLVDLGEALFYDFPEFWDKYLETAKALSHQHVAPATRN